MDGPTKEQHDPDSLCFLISWVSPEPGPRLVFPIYPPTKHAQPTLGLPGLSAKDGTTPGKYSTCIRTNLSVLEKRTTVFCMVSSSSSSSSLLGELSISATLQAESCGK